MQDDRFPAIEPHDSGMIDVGDGHRVYWECCGNPAGKPALYLHGGPGSGFSPGQRRFFDPSAYRVVLFDQRGCGRSRPLASSPDADLRVNTTAHLIADIEALRRLHGVERWTILGMSWGTTLALAYAQAHMHRVEALVLALVTTTSRREVEWITRDVGRIFPREWERFTKALPDSLRHLPPVDAYATLLFDADPAVRDHAAREWCAWEDAHISLTPGHLPNRRYEDPKFRLQFSRLVTHYWRHGAFLEDDQLLRDASRLSGIPGVLIHGRYDVSSPLDVAWQLSQRWSTTQLHVLDDAGHGGGVTLIAKVVGALNQFAST
ncbi:prolyl aminopeptidase [Bradyrhizobium ontarionense]|uniref:Proline iminopeptidase n=1 Tax=Bradyrhizobium ontarionense TaxID=2898149 RepID=A0ABY3RCE8_9BRAD|nr:prolyl aminopeptidase [Bradyrhizobium sp. A19]UFZ04879.1 prolyl aminopeptidase [Bradyrhizobium sp. A19]